MVLTDNVQIEETDANNCRLFQTEETEEGTVVVWEKIFPKEQLRAALG